MVEGPEYGTGAAPGGTRSGRGRGTVCGMPQHDDPAIVRAPWGPEVDGRRLLNEAVGFGRALRAAGLHIDLGAAVDYARALPLVDIGEREQVRAAGKWVFAGGLEPIESSTTVDNVNGDRIVTDGPFSESKEYLGGFWVIEAADLDEALDWAQRGSQACQGKVEVRPFQAE